MNFLAHAYLSFGNPDILVGNMIADMVKGKQIEQYPENVQHGIYIHRKIDAFTDNHPVTLSAMKFFRNSAHKYAGPFLDVSYDHFLAINKDYEPQNGWNLFADKCYKAIEQYTEALPPKFCSMFMYMRTEDWFSNYAHKWMIKRSFERLQQRATYLADNATIYTDFEKYYDEIGESFNEFFPDLIEYVKEISRNTII